MRRERKREERERERARERESERARERGSSSVAAHQFPLLTFLFAQDVLHANLGLLVVERAVFGDVLRKMEPSFMNSSPCSSSVINNCFAEELIALPNGQSRVLFHRMHSTFGNILGSSRNCCPLTKFHLKENILSIRTKSWELSHPRQNRCSCNGSARTSWVTSFFLHIHCNDSRIWCTCRSVSQLFPGAWERTSPAAWCGGRSLCPSSPSLSVRHHAVSMCNHASRPNFPRETADGMRALRRAKRKFSRSSHAKTQTNCDKTSCCESANIKLVCVCVLQDMEL